MKKTSYKNERMKAWHSDFTVTEEKYSNTYKTVWNSPKHLIMKNPIS